MKLTLFYGSVKRNYKKVMKRKEEGTKAGKAQKNGNSKQLYFKRNRAKRRFVKTFVRTLAESLKTLTTVL